MTKNVSLMKAEEILSYTVENIKRGEAEAKIKAEARETFGSNV